MNRIYAPFTPEQVEALNRYQQSDHVQPFTCGRRGDGLHGELWSDTGTLVATIDGWICCWCDYKQNWANKFMAQPVVNLLERIFRPREISS